MRLSRLSTLSIARAQRVRWRKLAIGVPRVAWVGELAGMGPSRSEKETSASRRVRLVGRLAVLRGLVDDGADSAALAEDLMDEARDRCRDNNLAAEIVAVANGRRMGRLEQIQARGRR
jgi:hypothetical protein